MVLSSVKSALLLTYNHLCGNILDNCTHLCGEVLFENSFLGEEKMTDTINFGPESYLDPAKNRDAQIATVWQFGIPWALFGGVLFAILAYIITNDSKAIAAATFLGLVIGFGVTVRNVPFPRNALREFFGGVDERGIGPSGLQCYHPRPIGSLFLQASIGERQTSLYEAERVESKDGTRLKVTYVTRRYFVKWILPYLRRIESTGYSNASEIAMIDLQGSLVRKFFRLYTDEEILNIRDINLVLSKVLSGELSEVRVPTDDLENYPDGFEEFSFPANDDGKTMKRRLMELGIEIPPGGVDVPNIDEPDDIATVKAERAEAKVRQEILASSVAADQALQDANPDIDVAAMRENVLATTGDADLIITRGPKVDGFAIGHAISSSPKRRKRGEASDSDKKSDKKS